MPTALARSTYQDLLNDISRLYETARRSQVRFAWETGKRIVQVEQKGDIRAAYGSQLLEKLSEDLTTKYGSGFSHSNLKRMRRYYMQNRIGSRVTQLPWSQQLALLSVKDERSRSRLEKLIAKDGLTTD